MRKVRVAVFSTGDELQLPGQPLGDGQIYDTNRLAVHLMLQQLGYEVINLGIIPDDPAKLRDAFIAADQQADVVISSGGVSVGEADYTKTILEELGRSASGNWRSSRGNPSPSANSVAAGSAACRVTRFPPPSPSVSWCSRCWRNSRQARPASGNPPAGTRRHATEEVAGPSRLTARYSAAQPRWRAGGDHHRPSGLAHFQLIQPR